HSPIKLINKATIPTRNNETQTYFQCLANSTGALDTFTNGANIKSSNWYQNSGNSVYSYNPLFGTRRLVSPTQVVHTTPDRLAQTMHMQQRVYQMRLNMITEPARPSYPIATLRPPPPPPPLVHRQEQNQQSHLRIPTRETSDWPTCFCVPQVSDNIRCDKSGGIKPESHYSGRWIVRRRTDGTRYITRRCSSQSQEFGNPENWPCSVNCSHSHPRNRTSSSEVECIITPNRSRFPSAPTRGSLTDKPTTDVPRIRSSSTSKPNNFPSRKVLIPPLMLDDSTDTLLSVTTL
ncbi:hypothetical protein FBUS_02261, partial [Fasciolopsis buskii]